MTEIVEDLAVNAASLIPGDMIDIAPAIGQGVFNHGGKKYVRNSTTVTSNADLDPSLLSKKQYNISGGQKTLAKALGPVVATASGTVLIFTYSSQFAYKSLNNGVDFVQKALPSFNFNSEYRDGAAISPITGTVIACVRTTSHYSAGIRRSTDCWETTEAIDISGSESSSCIFCASDGTWYLGTTFGKIHKSTNDGVSWSLTGNTANSTIITSIIEAADNRIIACSTGSDIFYSDNNGSNWTQAYDNVAISYLGKRGGDKVLIATSKTQLKNRISKDNGETWTPWNLINKAAPNGTRALWSDGNGKLIVGASYHNYDGDKDKTTWFLSTDFGDSIVELGVTECGDAIGLSEGANQRLFTASKQYHSTNSPVSYTYFDYGFKTGGDTDNKTQATLIKNEV